MVSLMDLAKCITKMALFTKDNGRQGCQKGKVFLSGLMGIDTMVMCAVEIGMEKANTLKEMAASMTALGS